MPQIFRRHRGDDGGIQPAGQERPNRYVGHQLPANGILQQIPGLLAGFLKGIGAGRVMELPIAADMKARFVKIAAGARLQLINAPEHPIPRRASRPEKQQVIEPPGIYHRQNLRKAEQAFEL